MHEELKHELVRLTYSPEIVNFELTREQGLEILEEIERLKEMKLHTEKYASEMEDKYILEKNKNDKAIEAINIYQNEKTLSIGYEDLKRIRGILQGNELDLRMFEEYLQEFKGVDKEGAAIKK